MLFDYEEGRTAAETTHDSNETFDDEITNELSARKWFKLFRSGGSSFGTFWMVICHQ